MDHSAVEEIRKNLDALSAEDLERERNRTYYNLHKEKIATSRKDNSKRKQEKVCVEEGLPVILAPYIKFYNPKGNKKDRVALTFDSKKEMIVFLLNLKFKDNITKEQLDALYKKYNT